VGLRVQGGVWMALHVGRSLDHYTNYQVMGKARELWPQVPQVPVGKRRMGCIVGMMHIKECVAAHLCRDRWKSIPTSHPYYLVTPPAPLSPDPSPSRRAPFLAPNAPDTRLAPHAPGAGHGVARARLRADAPGASLGDR